MKRYIYYLPLFLCIVVFSIQSNGQNTFLMGGSFGGGSSFFNLENNTELASGVEKTQGLTLLSADFYVQQRFLHKWGIQAGIGMVRQSFNFADNYTTSTGNIQLTKFNNRSQFAEANFAVFKLFNKFKGVQPYTKFGFTYSFRSTDTQTSLNNYQGTNVTYRAETQYPNENNLGLRPEIGFIVPTGEMGEFTFSFAYNIGNSDVMNGTYTANSLPAKDYSYNAEGNYTRLGIGYNQLLHKGSDKKKVEKSTRKQDKLLAKKAEKEQKNAEKEKLVAQKEAERLAKQEAKNQIVVDTLPKQEIVYDKSGIPTQVKDSKVHISRSFEVYVEELEISYWDHGHEIDGDTISLNFNGEWLVENVGLTKEKYTVKIKLEPKGKNVLILYAHNEGLFPPNTAAISFFNGKKEVRYDLRSKIGDSDAIRLIYKAP